MLGKEIIPDVIGTFLGAIVGFIFALILFFLKEYYKERKDKKNIIKSLKREFEYNLSVFNTWIEVLRSHKQDVKSGLFKENAGYVINKIKFQSTVLDSIFSKGGIYDIFELKDIEYLYYLLSLVPIFKNELIDIHFHKIEELKFEKPDKNEIDMMLSNLDQYIAMLQEGVKCIEKIDHNLDNKL